MLGLEVDQPRLELHGARGARRGVDRQRDDTERLERGDAGHAGEPATSRPAFERILTPLDHLQRLRAAELPRTVYLLAAPRLWLCAQGCGPYSGTGPEKKRPTPQRSMV
jgi:hypothetical protein